ncbi:MAG TPA: DUF1573 domain-containing protein [Bacteroidales bacterium]|nr:DUF1573 domain-containing protein [Bacteroidales bacterium]
MKTTKLLTLCLFLFASTLVAKGQADKPQTNSPVISFEKLEHDYGTIKKGSDGTCEFVFKNTGKEPLILSNVKSSCGCTVPTWPKDPIIPGQNGVIKVVYDTKKVGTISKTITVISNAEVGVVTLSIKGNVTE